MFKFILATATTSSSDGIIPEEAVKEFNAFTSIWKKIDWDSIIPLLISKGIILLITLGILFVVKTVGNKIINKSFKSYAKSETYSEGRVETLHNITKNAFQYLLYFILFYTVLTLLGVPVSSLIAGAGIAGIAIGLGAQGFINDFLTGFFIILERQIDVGDHVYLDAIEGHVVSVGMRTTQIKDIDGTLHFIPNRNITIVSNMSRENMRAMIKLRITPEHDVAQITEIIEQTNKKMLPNYPEIQVGPKIIGVVDLGNGILAIQVDIFTLHGSQIKVRADFLAAYVTAVREAGIELPESPVNLVI